MKSHFTLTIMGIRKNKQNDKGWQGCWEIGTLSDCFPGGSVSRVCYSATDLGLIPGQELSPGEGNGNPLQYSCLGNPMDWGAWWAQSKVSQELGTTERLNLHCWWECKMAWSLWKTFWCFHKNLSIELLFNPGISPPNLYLGRMKTQMNIHTKMHTQKFTLTQKWQQ